MADNSQTMTDSRLGTARERRENPRQPRVLIIAASMRYMGGQSVMAQRLVADLRGAGVDVDFLPVDPRPPWPLSYLDNVKILRTIVRSICYGLSLLRRVPAHDVIHIFSASYWSFFISPAPALVVGRLFGKRVVLNYHSGEAEDHLRRSGPLTKGLIRLADSLLVQSQFLAGVFQKFGFAADVIPNHIDLSGMTYVERRDLQPRILVPRALEPLYNIPCALRAFQIVQSTHPAAEMTILGDGSQRQELIRLTKSLRLRGVTFAGRVERAEIPRLFDQHDLILNTSSVDNMPVSLLEGLAAGLPIVTTCPGGIPDIVEDGRTGCVVAINDHVAAAECILRIVAHPDEAQQFSLAGREAADRYTWEAVAPMWLRLYRGLAPDDGQSNPRSTRARSVETLQVDELPCK